MPKHIRLARDKLREGGRERERKRGAWEGEGKEKGRVGFVLKRVLFGRLKGQACRTQTIEFLQ